MFHFMFSFLRLVLRVTRGLVIQLADRPEEQLPKVGGLVTRSLGLSSSIAVGLISAFVLIGDGNSMAQAAEAQFAAPRGDAARGRALFVSKGCVACHAIHEIGGTTGPPLDIEFAPDEVESARLRRPGMWRGAEAMVSMQQSLFGAQLDFTGPEPADIIAFAHDPREQRKFSEADVPPALRRLIFEQ